MVNHRSGRRTGESGSREAILVAARRAFAERGYGAATLRAIAGEAGVDPALVLHFFGSKDGLFAAAVRPPVDPDTVAATVAGGPPGEAGARLARLVVRTLEDPGARDVVIGLIRTSAADERAARMVRELYVERMYGAVARHVGADEPDLRAALVGSQIVGLAMARHVLRVEPLASMSPATLEGWLGPLLQRHLSGPLAEAPQAGAEPGHGEDGDG
jgi:AcrR family transcriptional regulator